MLCALLVLTLSACGSQEDAINTDLLCPAQKAQAVLGRFNAGELVGKSLAEARKVALDHTCDIRVVGTDRDYRRPRLITADLVLNRINVIVEDNRITSISEIG
jgi:hypothetical protein